MKRILLISALLLAVIFTVSADRRRMLMTGNVAAAGGISFRSFTTNFSGASTVLTVDMPAGIVSGDVITSFIVTDSVSFLNTLDVGWTVLETNELASAGFWVIQKVSDGTEGATETHGFSASEVQSVITVVHSGANASPFDSDAIGTGVGASHVTPSVTPSANNSMILGCIFIDPASAVTYTQVTGYTLLATCDRGANGSLALAQKLQTTATAEGVSIDENLVSTFGEYTMSIKP